MGQYLIDTNVVSDYLCGALPESGFAFMDQIIDAKPKLSIITQIELLSWKTDTFKEQLIQDFICDSEIFDITTEVVRNCVQIRRNMKIKTPDAIIASTAIAFDLTLISNNDKDFSPVKGLKYLNPYKI